MLDGKEGKIGDVVEFRSAAQPGTVRERTAAVNSPPKGDQRTFLYRHFDNSGRLLYVGVSLSAVQRLIQHKDNSLWFADIARIEVQPFGTRSEALAAERQAVSKEKPIHNKQLQTPEEIPKERPRRVAAAVEQPIVRLNPVYKLDAAAQLIGVATSMLRRLIDDGQIGYIELRPQRKREDGRIVRYYGITGWQIVEFIESIERRNGAVRKVRD